MPNEYCGQNASTVLQGILEKPPYNKGEAIVFPSTETYASALIVSPPLFSLRGGRRNLSITVNTSGRTPVTIYKYLPIRVT